MTAKLLMAGLAISMALGPVVRAEENVRAEIGVDLAAVREDGFWNHMSRNWLKYVAGALTMVAGYKAAEHNNWLGMGDDDDEPAGRTAQRGDGNNATTTAQDNHAAGVDAEMITEITGDHNTVTYDITVINVPME